MPNESFGGYMNWEPPAIPVNALPTFKHVNRKRY